MKRNRGKSVWKRAGAAFLATAIVATTCVTTSLPARAADSWPNNVASAEPTFAGYRVKDVKNWNPETDPDAELLRAKIPLQNRNEAFKATQAKPYLESNAQVMLMQGDYGNSFFGSTLYTNEFSEHVLNFWQYADYYSPWHGAATAYTPQSLYDPVTSDWRARGFEFGIVNIPNPAYTNAAHKNGVLSIACIYFDPAFRPGQTCVDMIEQDSEGAFPVADQLIAMAEYFGYDGYFLNQEEGSYQEFKPFMAYLTSKGLWTQWYDTNSTFNSSKAAWLKDDTYGQIHNSVFVNYGSYFNIDTQISYAESIGVDPFKEVFYGLECNQNKFSGNHGSARNISGLYDETGNPRASVALFTPSDWYQRGVDELSISKGDELPLMQQNEYQWMVAERERMFFSGVYTDPTNTGLKSGYSRPDVGVSNAAGWVGVADFIAERSVIGGTSFYTNFNTGHGVQYFKNGMVSKDEEWTNINIQDILPTWQWWIESTDETKLTPAFDYGTKYTENDASGNTKTLPYTQVGAYDGGSSLVLYGNLTGADTMHLYKTDLSVNANSKLDVTFKKTSTDNASMKLGLIFKDAPETTVKVDVANSTVAGDWTTSTIDLSAYAGKSIAAITLEFEGEAENYQMNIGGLRISDGTYKPAAPTGFKVDRAFADGQMIVKWDIADYDTVKQYNLYGVMSDGSRVYLGGTYDDILYVKSTFGETESVTLELCAVGKDGTESEPATYTYTYNDKPSNVQVAEANTESGLLVRASTPGKLAVSFDAPKNGAPDSYEFEVILRNIESDHPENKVYTHTVEGTATSAEISLPITEGREYDLKIYAVKNGERGDAICYRGWSNDSYSQPLSVADLQINGQTIRLVDPDSVDWYKMHVTFDGEQIKSFKRGATSGRSMNFSLSKSTGILSIVVEDFAGNQSAPLDLAFINGSAYDLNAEYGADLIPDDALRGWLQTNVGKTIADLAAFNGAMDLSKVGVADITGLTILTGITELNLSGNNLTTLDGALIPDGVTKLNLSDNKELTEVTINNRTNLDLDLTGCIALETLKLENFGNKELNLTGCTNLTNLYLRGSQLTSLDITDCVKLHNFDISNSNLESITAADASAYTDAYYWNWTGAKLDLTASTKEGILKDGMVAYFENAELEEEIDPEESVLLNKGSTANTKQINLSLPAYALITKVTYKNDYDEGYGINSGTVSVSSDGQNYTQVAAFSNVQLDEEKTIELPEGTRGQYVRIDITDGRGWGYNMKVWGRGTAPMGYSYGNQQPALTRDIKTIYAKDNGASYNVIDVLNSAYASTRLVQSGTLLSTLSDVDWLAANYVSNNTVVPENAQARITNSKGQSYEFQSAGTFVADVADVYTVSFVSGYNTLLTSEIHVDHDFVDGAYTAPSCTEEGAQVKGCINCGHEITVSVPKAEHTWDEGVITAPSCTEEGFTTFTCVECGETMKGDVVKALGHNHEAVVTAPSCETVGYTTYTCSECGDSYVSNVVAALGHSYTSVVTAPTCDAMGYTTHTCERCGDSYIDSFVPATEHDYEKTVTKEATCTEEGELTFTCKHEGCGKTYTQVLPKADHDCEATVVEATCLGYGYTQYKCANCDHSYIDALTQPLGHSYKAVVTAPTCDEGGYTTHTCERCGDSYVDSYTDALGHKCDAFTDIADHWGKDAICFVTERGLFAGTTATTFGPNVNMTRGMLVTVLYRLEGEPFTKLDSAFTDVEADAYFAAPIAWAAANGIVAGKDATTFAPYEDVTREQMAAILMRYAKYKGYDVTATNDLAAFADASSISEYAVPAMQWAVGAGIISGRSATTLVPGGDATRAEVASLLTRFVALIEK